MTSAKRRAGARVFSLAVALALAWWAFPALAQSRFDGTNDVPGQRVINGTTTKIKPDRIPEEPSVGDTTLRPRFYMSPSSRCTKLEDRLPGGCEANTVLRKNAFKRGLIYQDGAPSGFPLSAIVLLP
jgi:hypothetical protein